MKYTNYTIQQAVEAFARVEGHHPHDLHQATFDILAMSGLRPQSAEEAIVVFERTTLPPTPDVWTPQNRMEYEEAAVAALVEVGERMFGG
jgi:hypothetical protein